MHTQRNYWKTRLHCAGGKKDINAGSVYSLTSSTWRSRSEHPCRENDLARSWLPITHNSKNNLCNNKCSWSIYIIKN